MRDKLLSLYVVFTVRLQFDIKKQKKKKKKRRIKINLSLLVRTKRHCAILDNTTHVEVTTEQVHCTDIYNLEHSSALASFISNNQGRSFSSVCH